MSIFRIIEGLNPLYFILSILGFLTCFFTKKRGLFLTILFANLCLCLMILWRFFIYKYSSSRYSNNLYFFIILNITFFLYFLKNVFPKNIFLFLLSILLFSIFFKFINYNHRRFYMRDSISLMNQAHPNATCAVYIKEHPKSILPYHTVVFDYHRIFNFKNYFFNACNHYKYRHNSFYILSSFPVEQNSSIDQLRPIGEFIKNNHNRKEYIYYFNNTSDDDFKPLLSDRTLSQESLPTDNIIKNGSFEKPHRLGNYFYQNIGKSKVRGVIPDGKFFPENYDLRWTPGYTDDASPEIFLQDASPISGKYSLLLRFHSLIGIRICQLLSKGHYLFECDLRSTSPIHFGLQFSLRDDDNTFWGFREFQPAFIEPDATRHFQFEITPEMVYPGTAFYICMCFYDEGEVMLDNICLVPLDNQQQN